MYSRYFIPKDGCNLNLCDIIMIPRLESRTKNLMNHSCKLTENSLRLINSWPSSGPLLFYLNGRMEI